MKRNKLTDGFLYVYNLAIRRSDGKVEQDTVFRPKLFTQDEIKAISEKHCCSVIVSCVGIYKSAKDKFVKENTFCVELPKPVEVANNGN